MVDLKFFRRTNIVTTVILFVIVLVICIYNGKYAVYSVPREYVNCFEVAKEYREDHTVSKVQLREHLLQPKFNFDTKSIEYAVNTISIDYKQNCLDRAQLLTDVYQMPKYKIYDVLLDYEGYTEEEVYYAVNHININ